MQDVNKNNETDSSSNVLKQWPIIIALAIIAIGVMAILIISLVYGLKGGKDFDKYGVVMDAGSSKTNTIMFKWKSNKDRGTGRVSEEDNCYGEGGIAKMNPMNLKPVIDCVKKVTSVIAPASLTKTPLFFAASAGMRLLNSTNPSRVNEIIHQLRVRLPETRLDLKEIEIISGRDEGIYAWIATNFLLDTLDRPQTLDPWEPTTYGSLHMGGTSLQIAFAVRKKNTEDSEIMKLKLYGQTHNVFSQTNLCFGSDEAHNRYQTLLLNDKVKRKGTIVEDPCAPEGQVKNITGAKLFQSICAQYGEIENVTFTYVGKSDPDACRQSVSELLNDDLCKRLNFRECFKHTDLQDQKFIAFATFFYTTDFLKISNVTLEVYENTMVDVCRANHAKVKTLTNNNPYGSQYCFIVQYIYEVLINGYGFDNNTWEHLSFMGKIADQDLGWTLGYMINATNIIPEKTTPRLISTTSALTVSLLLFVLIIITTIFLLYTWKRRNE